MASLVEVAFLTQGRCRLCFGWNVPLYWNGGGRGQRRRLNESDEEGKERICDIEERLILEREKERERDSANRVFILAREVTGPLQRLPPFLG